MRVCDRCTEPVGRSNSLIQIWSSSKEEGRFLGTQHELCKNCQKKACEVLDSFVADHPARAQGCFPRVVKNSQVSIFRPWSWFRTEEKTKEQAKEKS